MGGENYLKYVVEQALLYQMANATFLNNSNSHDHIFEITFHPETGTMHKTSLKNALPKHLEIFKFLLNLMQFFSLNLNL